LINGAGGNSPIATTGPDQPFFELPADALRFVCELNIIGTILPSQVFGRYMAGQGEGVILNISSMNALRPLTKIPAYSAAKAAVSNFTQWLAVHMAQEYSHTIRVNAIAPGFFLTLQNKFLLTDEATGELTPRGQSIIGHTPMGRFGDPEDLLGPVLWLLSPASAFVTGVVVPIDGGFSAYSGVKVWKAGWLEGWKTESRVQSSNLPSFHLYKMNPNLDPEHTYNILTYGGHHGRLPRSSPSPGGIGTQTPVFRGHRLRRLRFRHHGNQTQRVLHPQHYQALGIAACVEVRARSI
jgi:hypothetical protein